MRHTTSVEGIGTRINGPHVVVDAKGLRVGSQTDRTGERYATLTRARRACRGGQAIVRDVDRVVVGIKRG